MKKLYIHVGTHKTGTTAIQYSLLSNQETLKNHNLLYPKKGRPTKGAIHGHHLLPWSFLDKYKNYIKKIEGENLSHKDIFNDLLEELRSSDCTKIILSSENFELLDTESIIKIKEYFFDFDVYVVFYFRNHLKYMLSFYKQTIIDGQYHDFINFVDNFFCWADYSKKIKKWGNVFGNEKVLFEIYEKSSNAGIVNSFINIIDKKINEVISFENKHINTSNNDNYIILRRFKNRFKLNYFEGNQRLKTFVDTIISKLLFSQKLYREKDIEYLKKRIKFFRDDFCKEYLEKDDYDIFLF